ncbi:Hpt domain-containing protein [Persicobacter sp. CCB-QB2]|uniref:Hpt domain-containing protein n=1 Tax=Persicobacter sp. CCB-QB2 TaxID=1561025 RepID=UPI0006A947EC|nr:Hpt domain-containing protein [Persicobacter sp. CCB-QB2]
MSKLTDLTYLKSVCDGDSSFMTEMIETFLQGTPEIIDQLKVACKNQNWAEVGAVAHKVKPSITFMGIESMKDLILDIEHSGKDARNVEKLMGKIEEFENGCEMAYRELRETIAEINA